MEEGTRAHGTGRRRARRARWRLLWLPLLACACTPTSMPDAGTDAGVVDAAPPPPRDSAPPPPVPRPPRPRPPDAGCPPPPDPGAAWLVDLPLTSLDVGDVVRAADGGAWVVATGGLPRRLWWVRIDMDGAPRFARRAEFDVADAPRAAPLPEGGIVIAAPIDDDLAIVRVAASGEVQWARRRTLLDDRYRGPAAIAADAEGIAVAGSVSRSSTQTDAVDFSWFSLDGELVHARRLTNPGVLVSLDAMAISAEHAVLSIRTDGFSTRTYLSDEDVLPVVTPWVVAFGRDGELDWDVAFDVAIGNDLHLDTVTRSTSGWALGGASERSGGRPWLVELTTEGLVRNVTELPRLAGLAVVDLARDDAGLRLMQSTDDLLYLGRANDEPEAVVRLNMLRGVARLLPGRGLYAGPPPTCDTTAINHPSLCGEARRSLMMLPLPGDSVSPCMRALYVEPDRDQERERPLPVPLFTDIEPTAAEADVTPLPVTAADVPFEAQRLCMSGSYCVRAFGP